MGIGRDRGGGGNCGVREANLDGVGACGKDVKVGVDRFGTDGDMFVEEREERWRCSTCVWWSRWRWPKPLSEVVRKVKVQSWLGMAIWEDVGWASVKGGSLRGPSVCVRCEDRGRRRRGVTW